MHCCERAKFHVSRAIVGRVDLLPSCHRSFEGTSLAEIYFIVGISWFSIFFSWKFLDPELLLVGINFFLVVILLVQFFSRN